jgi:cell pole-organizing protein PopZ
MAQTGSAQREPSMEEILASIRRIIQDSDPAQHPAVMEPELEVAAAPREPALREVEAFRAEFDEPVPGPVDVEPEAVSAPAAPLEIAAPESRDAEPAPVFDMAGESDGAADLPPPDEAPERAAEPRSAIISDHAGRQVAAAFGELSEAFAASRRRSFDEMAQEMLRPMLQEWLDNNLPTLVEKLVREEIERVARGG